MLSALQSDAPGPPAKPALRGAPNQSKPLFQRDPASQRELKELAHRRATSREILINDREAGLPQQRLEVGPKIEFVRLVRAEEFSNPLLLSDGVRIPPAALIEDTLRSIDSYRIWLMPTTDAPSTDPSASHPRLERITARASIHDNRPAVESIDCRGSELKLESASVETASWHRRM